MPVSSHLFVVALSAAMLVGCATSPQSETPAAAPATRSLVEVDPSSEEALVEIGFRQILENAPKDEPIFLSLRHGPRDAVDPPIALVQRLADLQLQLRPVAEIEFCGFSGIVDRKSGKRGHVYWAVIKDRVSATKVHLDIGHWEGYLAAGGEELTFELQNGRWVRTELDQTKIWVS